MGEQSESWLDQVRDALHRGSTPQVADSVAERWEREGHAVSSTDRLGLRFHLRSGRSRRRKFLDLRFPRLIGALTVEQRDALISAWLAAPAGAHPDWSGNLAGFLAIVEQAVGRGELPAAALEIAHHEQTLGEVRRSDLVFEPGATPASLRPNPTLQVLQLTHDLPGWLSSGASDWPDPLEQPVLLGYFRKAGAPGASWRRLDESALAALRVVTEDLDPAQVAQAAGTERSVIVGNLMTWAEHGLLVARTEAA